MALYIKNPDSQGTCCECSTRPLPCDTCQEGVTCVCGIAMPIAGGTNQIAPITMGTPEYATSTDARTALDDLVSNCIGVIGTPIDGAAPYPYLTAFTVSDSTANQITLNGSALTHVYAGANVAYIWMFASLNLKAASPVSISFAGNNLPGGNLSNYCFIWKCDGTAIYAFSNNGASGSLPTFTPPADGEYIIQVGKREVSSSLGATSTVLFTLSATFLKTNPVSARWDDSGTVMSLDACPKLLLPLFTEQNGAIYTTLSEALNAMSGTITSCKVYGGITPCSLVSISGTTINASGTSVIPEDIDDPDFCIASGFESYFSVNLVEGESVTISCAGMFEGYNEDPLSSASAIITVYNPATSQVVGSASDNDFSSGASAFGNFTASYTGKYLVVCSFQGENVGFEFITGFSASASIFANTISVNEIQALYDTGLDCAGRVGC